MDDGLAAVKHVMCLQAALTTTGNLNISAITNERPCEVPFSFAYFSFGQAKEK